MQGIGKDAETIAQRAIKSGQPIPDSILNAPELKDTSAFYLTAYFDLDSERQIGEMVGPIPRSKIMEYANELNMNSEDKEDFYYIVKEIDIAMTRDK